MELTGETVEAQSDSLGTPIMVCAIVTASISVVLLVLSMGFYMAKKAALVGVLIGILNFCQALGLGIAITVMSSSYTSDLEKKGDTSLALGDEINNCSDEYMDIDVDKIERNIGDATRSARMALTFGVLIIIISVLSLCCTLSAAVIASKRR